MTAVEDIPVSALDELKQHGGPIFDALARHITTSMGNLNTREPVAVAAE